MLLKVIASKKLKRDFDLQIAYTMMKTNNFLIPASVEACNIALRKVQKEIKALEKDPDRLRSEDLETAISDALRDGNKKKAQEIKYKIKAEETKKMFAKIRMYKGSNIAGITSIKIPEDPDVIASENCEEWITVETPKELQEALQQRNQRHFGQALGTFPTIPPFSEKIDWGASTHTSKLILKGEYDDSEISESVRRFV